MILRKMLSTVLSIPPNSIINVLVIVSELTRDELLPTMLQFFRQAISDEPA